MGDVLDEAYAIAQCKDCPWYKSCVMPMRFTAEDIRRQLESSAPGTDISQQAEDTLVSPALALAAIGAILPGHLCLAIAADFRRLFHAGTLSWTALSIYSNWR